MSSSEQDVSRLSSIKTEILVAWIFAILSFIGFFIAFLLYLAIGVVGSGFGFAAIGIVLAIPFLILAIISFLVVRRTGQMRAAANKGDIMRLKGLNSIGWAIIALIFSGIIPGIMLLIAHGPIDELKKPG